MKKQYWVYVVGRLDPIYKAFDTLQDAKNKAVEIVTRQGDTCIITESILSCSPRKPVVNCTWRKI